jgi:hypothetical protein
MSTILTDTTDNTDTTGAIAALVRRTRAAQEEFAHYGQRRVDDLVTAVGWAIYEPGRAKALAEISVRDTGLGNVADKISKNQRRTFGTLRDLDRAAAGRGCAGGDGADPGVGSGASAAVPLRAHQTAGAWLAGAGRSDHHAVRRRAGRASARGPGRIGRGAAGGRGRGRSARGRHRGLHGVPVRPGHRSSTVAHGENTWSPTRSSIAGDRFRRNLP